MSIIFFGTPEFAVASLNALIHSGEEISLVVTQTDKRKGRGHLLAPPPVKVTALKAGLKVAQPGKLNDEAFFSQLEGLKPELIAVVAYGKILPKRLLQMPLRGCINVHASLLPKFRGAAPIQWAIMKGENKTGVTTMLMDEGLDTGPILLRREVDIGLGETAGSLSRKLSAEGATLLIETIKGLREGFVRPAPQQGEASYAPPLKKEDGLIDWTMSATEIVSLIHAMQPWPGAYCHVNNERVILLEAEAVSGSGKAGMIVNVVKEFLIGAGSGLLSVKSVQPSGKKPMTAAAFIAGRRVTEGMSVR